MVFLKTIWCVAVCHMGGTTVWRTHVNSCLLMGLGGGGCSLHFCLVFFAMDFLFKNDVLGSFSADM